jgi:hypothetical protein
MFMIAHLYVYKYLCINLGIVDVKLYISNYLYIYMYKYMYIYKYIYIIQKYQ